MFENTKRALEEFQTKIECNKCRTTKKDLQYLGTSCKHAFCWDCISDFSQKIPGRRSSVARHQCPTCAFPLDTTKIIGAHMLNTCYESLSDLRNLLDKATTSQMTQVDIACTQNIFDKDAHQVSGNQGAIDRFLETQTHMPDELGQLNDEESTIVPKVENRENSHSPELDIFHDYSADVKSARSSVKRSSTSTEHERKPKRSSVLKTVKNEPAEPNLFASQIPQRTHENDLLTPFLERRSTAPYSSGVGKYAQSFGSSKKDENDPFTTTIVLPKRQASLEQLSIKTPKVEPVEEPEEQPSISKRSRKVSVKMENIERRSQSPMSFGEKSMSLKPEQRRSSFGTRRGELVIINSIQNNRIPQLQAAVDAGTCVNEKDNKGKTPLYLAVEYNSLEAAKILVEAGAVINASCEGTSSQRKLKTKLLSGGSTLETTLHEAVRRSNLPMIEYLLSKGASMKIRNSVGKTAEDLAKNDPKAKKIIEKFKTEQRALQPVILPPKSRIYFVQLIDEKMLSDSEKRKLPGKINLIGSDMNTQTHVVVAVDPKTRVLNINKDHIGEVLRAIVKPGMIVSHDWLKACITDSSKVDDDYSYLVRKVRWMESQIFENTIEIWKKTITKMQPGLFAGCKFYIPKPKYNFLDRPTLIEIVRSGGGQASARDTLLNEKDPAPYHNSRLKPNFVIYSLTHDIGEKFRDCAKYNLVSEQWFIEAILSCSISTPPH
ncbi:hypothetical protein GCK72_009961 [Caenorhabditis remanei]|uniref:Uncharacterized protein n=1 Tax=Caenorhabditis remanei TaxID=31234 RepID=A0A6A5H3X9_CAERE|nr:hypothetical protein GCK72_009961 [Caenorhabditis remanei]KAF1761705.1 hypothetical protein GCK72_009961 [Caenorhabditis remanei]